MRVVTETAAGETVTVSRMRSLKSLLRLGEAEKVVICEAYRQLGF